jgi:hypothetical protein
MGNIQADAQSYTDIMRIGPDSGIPGEQSREHDMSGSPVHIAAAADAVRDGWKATIEDTYRMVDDREADGYRTALVVAAETMPRGPTNDDHKINTENMSGDINVASSIIMAPPECSSAPKWGISHVVPRNAEDSIEFIDPPFTVDETLVYQRVVKGTVFIVTECICIEEVSPPRSLFIAGAYSITHAASLVRVAMNCNRMISHLHYLDGTHIATLLHGDATTFFPNPERFLNAGLSGE